MVINDIERDFKTYLKANDISIAELGRMANMGRTNVHRVFKNKIPDSLVRLWEILGYDIKITYVKRNKSAEEILKGDK